MLNLRALFLGLFVIFQIISCSKEDTSESRLPGEDQQPKGILSFGSLLGNFGEDNFKTVFDEVVDIPQCSEENPKYIRVAIKNASDNSWVAGKDGINSFIEIEVNPNGSDTNNDQILDSWFTKESQDLELDAGVYTIEYFAVLDGNGPNAEIIYLAPRKDDNYGPISFQNYVNNPLPVEVNILSGEKHYAPVEVLCYDKQLAIAFGYLFFDFTNPNFIYLCSFGNICDDLGRHSPANFSQVIWKFDENGVYDATNLLADQYNSINSIIDDDEVERFYGDLICIPLPDQPGEDKFFGRIYLIEDNSSETLIREGSFTDTDILQNLYAEEKFSLYHFRENCCDSQDNFPLLQDLTTENCDVVCTPCEGGVSELSLKYLHLNSQQVLITSNETILFEGIADFENIIELNVNGPLNFLGAEIKIYINETLYKTINTSCTEAIGPGFLSGYFEVVSGKSVLGGELCPVPPTEDPDCATCDGKVTKLTLKYTGEETSIKIIQSKDGVELFNDVLTTNQQFEVVGTYDKNGSITMWTNLEVYKNNIKHTDIHTSCSIDIRIGSVFGDFEVIFGSSLNGGEFCQ